MRIGEAPMLQKGSDVNRFLFVSVPGMFRFQLVKVQPQVITAKRSEPQAED